MIELFSDVQREKFYLRVALSSTTACTRASEALITKWRVFPILRVAHWLRAGDFRASACLLECPG